MVSHLRSTLNQFSNEIDINLEAIMLDHLGNKEPHLDLLTAIQSHLNDGGPCYKTYEALG